MLLESLGADSRLLSAFQTYAAAGLTLARVSLSQRDHYHLFTESGELEAEPSGALWYRTPDRAGMPVVGDWVAARVVDDHQATVEIVLPRRTCFSRRAAGRREEQQPVAANVDLIFLISGLDGDFNLRRLERYLTLAAESGASPVLVLNKADLCRDLPARIDQANSVAGGSPVIACSAGTGEGMDALATLLAPGLTVALLGSSGVGKSTIVNCLLGEQHLRTAEVRESDSRGRHTTTHRELMPLPGGGALIDTPGMRELQLWAGPASVDSAFDEIAAVAAECRFRDCTHCGEPGCAVAAALSTGAISRPRWESYEKLRGEAFRHQILTDKLAAREQKRKWKVMQKAYRRDFKTRLD
jgi:ribosome biogenesis GTPase / thiamine phosphate phosphatase